MVHFPFFVALGGGLGLRTALWTGSQYEFIGHRMKKKILLTGWPRQTRSLDFFESKLSTPSTCGL